MNLSQYTSINQSINGALARTNKSVRRCKVHSMILEYDRSIALGLGDLDIGSSSNRFDDLRPLEERMRIVPIAGLRYQSIVHEVFVLVNVVHRLSSI